MLARMTIKTRLVTLLTAGMLVLMLVIAGAFVGISALQEATQDIADRRIQLIRNANRIMYGMADNRSEILLALQHDPHGKVAGMHDHPLSKHLDKIDANKVAITEYFAEMEKGSKSEAGRKRLQELVDARNLYVSEGIAPAYARIKERDYDQAEKVLQTKVNPLLNGVLEKARALAAHEDEGARQALQQAMASAKNRCRS